MQEAMKGYLVGFDWITSISSKEKTFNNLQNHLKLNHRLEEGSMQDRRSRQDMYLFDTYLTSRHKAFLFLFLSVNMRLKASKKLTKESYKWTFYRVSNKKVVTLWGAKSLPTFGSATAIIFTENLLLQSSLYYRMILWLEVLQMFRKCYGTLQVYSFISS